MATIRIVRIKNKTINIFDSHQYALAPWAEARERLGQPPRLLTLDFHTDTKPAFLNFSFYAVNGGRMWQDNPELRKRQLEVAQAELERLTTRHPSAIKEAVEKLKFDEQIDAATRSGIIDVAFVVANDRSHPLQSNEQAALEMEHDEFCRRFRDGHEERTTENMRRFIERPRASPPFTYTIPEDRIVEVPRQYFRRQVPDQVIEGDLLRQELSTIDLICRTAGIPRLLERPFILDIDLDVFNTRKAIQPDDLSEVSQLIQHCDSITIAREPECVELCRAEGETITAAELEADLLAIVERALT